MRSYTARLCALLPLGDNLHPGCSKLSLQPVDQRQARLAGVTLCYSGLLLKIVRTFQGCQWFKGEGSYKFKLGWEAQQACSALGRIGRLRRHNASGIYWPRQRYNRTPTCADPHQITVFSEVSPSSLSGSQHKGQAEGWNAMQSR